eukprot:5087106-Ditylum_brightwellii.AAC.1
MPAVDIWDCYQRHLYSSHGMIKGRMEEAEEEEVDDVMVLEKTITPLASNVHECFRRDSNDEDEDDYDGDADDDTTNEDRRIQMTRSEDTNDFTAGNTSTGSSLIINPSSSLPLPPPKPRNYNKHAPQWADEEGFYRVNRLLIGDFVILVRFGGPYSYDLEDPTKVLFRYCNNTSFMPTPGPCELPKGNVDMMRRYADSFEEDEFLITLLFDELPLDVVRMDDVDDEKEGVNVDDEKTKKKKSDVVEGKKLLEMAGIVTEEEEEYDGYKKRKSKVKRYTMKKRKLLTNGNENEDKKENDDNNNNNNDDGDNEPKELFSSLLVGQDAIEYGWSLLSKYHVLKPTEQDEDVFFQYIEEEKEAHEDEDYASYVT